jgi:hypothetical protein
MFRVDPLESEDALALIRELDREFVQRYPEEKVNALDLTKVKEDSIVFLAEAVLVLECTDVEEANEVLNTLPLVKEGLITFDFIPLAPYPGFARLFEEI